MDPRWLIELWEHAGLPLMGALGGVTLLVIAFADRTPRPVRRTWPVRVVAAAAAGVAIAAIIEGATAHLRLAACLAAGALWAHLLAVGLARPADSDGGGGGGDDGPDDDDGPGGTPQPWDWAAFDVARRAWEASKRPYQRA